MVDHAGVPGNPYDSALRFSYGEFSRDQVIHALESWAYVPAERPSPHLWEDPPNYVAGSLDDLTAALDDGLIDEEIYWVVLNALKSRGVEL